MEDKTCKVICFYLGKKCRYGDDAPVEEQMECSQCPVYIMWAETTQSDRESSGEDLT